ncbi:MAG: hypothetical protein ACP5O8_03345 [Candidatus Aenigmatarchaeota archaeon]
MNEEKRVCEYWLGGCFTIEDIAKDDMDASKTLMDKLCRTSEKPYACPAYQINQKIYKPLKKVAESTSEVESPYLRLILNIVAEGANLVHQEWVKETVKQSETYKLVKKEMKELAKK